MLLVTRVHSRRVFVLGAAGLVPAALVTLLYVHQPSIGDRRLYPTFRGSLALLGLGLALATLITWATAPHRLSRSSLTGLAWAGVATILCIGPFLESNPRQRLYALDLQSGDVVWSSAEAGTLAAGAFVPGSGSNPTTIDEPGLSVVVDRLEGTGWSLPFPGERVADVARVGEVGYAYVATTGADETHMSGRVVKFAIDDGTRIWTMGLPEDVAASDGEASIDANDHTVVVAGGELVAALNASNGRFRWTESVVTLGKSRGYALPGAAQYVTVDRSLAYLLTTPDG